ncbi:hypothetical protein [Rubrobacter indicoceani]|uniref:hypothetical protein n=1 Tax=Rubrobacter indicoceani TaxID=2051957 RepID=UPI000E5A70A7|nr:hypothetical protein [Rubrobacter indicoceani]
MVIKKTPEKNPQSEIPGARTTGSLTATKARWTGFPGEGMWSPSEQTGWWLTFGGDRSSSRAQAYGPFPAESDAHGYLSWVRTEATVNRHGHPAIVVALKAATFVRVVEVVGV